VKTEEMEINHSSFNKFKQNLEEEEIERKMESIKIEDGASTSSAYDSAKSVKEKSEPELIF
jgi:hypothetical protein